MTKKEIIEKYERRKLYLKRSVIAGVALGALVFFSPTIDYARNGRLVPPESAKLYDSLNGEITDLYFQKRDLNNVISSHTHILKECLDEAVDSIDNKIHDKKNQMKEIRKNKEFIDYNNKFDQRWSGYNSCLIGGLMLSIFSVIAYPLGESYLTRRKNIALEELTK